MKEIVFKGMHIKSVHLQGFDLDVSVQYDRCQFSPDGAEILIIKNQSSQVRQDDH